MTVAKRTAIIWWVGGLIAFAVTIFFHLPLITDGVPGGMAEHQSAPNAAVVDAIQNSWQGDGLINAATIAMVTDLIFIGIFGTGCVLAGLHYRARPKAFLRVFGWVALIAGAVFLVTDYAETIAQFTQLMRFAGDDDLAGLASTARPIKSLAWTAGFLSVLAALIADYFSAKAA